MASVITTGQQTVGTSSVKLIAGQSVGKGVRVRNTHASNTLFVGDSNVTASNGYPIPAGQSETLSFAGDLYAIASGSGTTVGFAGLS